MGETLQLLGLRYPPKDPMKSTGSGRPKGVSARTDHSRSDAAALSPGANLASANRLEVRVSGRALPCDDRARFDSSGSWESERLKASMAGYPSLTKRPPVAVRCSVDPHISLPPTPFRSLSFWPATSNLSDGTFTRPMRSESEHLTFWKWQSRCQRCARYSTRSSGATGAV